MENNAETAFGANTSIEMVQKKQCQSRNELRTRRECPTCKVTMTYQSLLYKHCCRGSPELKQQWLLERMDERIRQRLGPQSEVELDCCPRATPG